METVRSQLLHAVECWRPGAVSNNRAMAEAEVHPKEVLLVVILDVRWCGRPSNTEGRRNKSQSRFFGLGPEWRTC